MHLSLVLEGYFRSRKLKVNILHASMMFGREVFGEVIGKVSSSLLPVEAKLFLLDVTPHPVEAHVKLFFPVKMPWEVLLPFFIGVGGLGWPI